MKKILTTQITETIDKTTGELLHIESQKTIKEKINSENFYMVFLDYMAPLFQLNSDAARRVLDKLCQLAQFNTGVEDARYLYFYSDGDLYGDDGSLRYIGLSVRGVRA